MEIKNLGKTQLSFLRQSIVLNSLYLNDYNNCYNIDPHKVNNFMDSYIEYLYELASDDGYTSTDVLDIIHKYDNKNNLYDYAKSIEWLD